MKDSHIVMTAREQAELIECPRPAPPGAGDIAGRTLFSLISAGTELNWNYTGERFPNTPGYAAVFEVEETGDDVRGFPIGSLALCMGKHSSFQTVRAGAAWRVPDGMAPELAPLARLMGVPMATLLTTGARPVDRVMVTGLGPVGHLAAQIFAGCGFEVLAVDPDARRRCWIEAAGIHRTFASVPVDEGSLPCSVGLVLECSGHEQAVLDSCAVVRMGGEVVLVGVPWKRHTETSAHELLDRVFHRYATVRSGWEWQVPFRTEPTTPHSTASGIASALRWLAEGRVRPPDGSMARVPPCDAQATYQDLLAGRAPGLFTSFDWRWGAAQKPGP